MIPISRYQMRKLKIVGIKVLERRSLDGDTNGKITLIGEGSITTVQRREGWRKCQFHIVHHWMVRDSGIRRTQVLYIVQLVVPMKGLITSTYKAQATQVVSLSALCLVSLWKKVGLLNIDQCLNILTMVE